MSCPSFHESIARSKLKVSEIGKFLERDWRVKSKLLGVHLGIFKFS